MGCDIRNMRRNDSRLTTEGLSDVFWNLISRVRPKTPIFLPVSNEDEKIQKWLNDTNPAPTAGWEDRTSTGFQSFASLGFVGNEWIENAPEQWMALNNSSLTDARAERPKNYMFFPIISINNEPWMGNPPRRQFKCVLWDKNETNMPLLNGTIFCFQDIRPARLLQYVYYRCDSSRLANVVASSIIGPFELNYFHIAARSPWNRFSASQLLFDSSFYSLCVDWILQIQQPKTWIAFPNIMFENFCYRFENGIWHLGLIDYSGAIVYNGNEIVPIDQNSLLYAGEYFLQIAKTRGTNLLLKLKQINELNKVHDAYKNTPEKLWIALNQFSDINISISNLNPSNEKEQEKVRLGMFFYFFLKNQVAPQDIRLALQRFREAWEDIKSIKKET